MAETNKKINMGLFGDDEIEEKEVIRHDVGNDEKAEDIKQNEEKNTEKKVQILPKSCHFLPSCRFL